jgi:hypothetical protein
MKKEAKTVSDLRDLFQEVGIPRPGPLDSILGPKTVYSNRITVRDESVWA